MHVPCRPLILGVMADNLDALIILGLFCALLLAYLWFRFGAKRCPSCQRLVFGYFGPPVGIRRMYFHCSRCGTRFEGHKRLPQ